MAKIKKVTGLEILDSRGNPTVEATLELEDGVTVGAAVPSGASTGKFEAVELRDGDKDRYQGKGVLKAVNNINGPINDQLVGRDITKIKKNDWLIKELDGTNNKSKLGANAILAVSIAMIRALAVSNNTPLYQQIASSFDLSIKSFNLPTPYFNIINGGQHANNKLSIQEFMLVPLIDNSFEKKVRLGSEIYHQLKNILESLNLSTGLGDEGGFAPAIDDPKQVLDLIIEAGEKAGYKPEVDFGIGLDVAASEFCDREEGNFIYRMETFNPLDSKGLANYLLELATNYPIISIEDPLDQEDWQGWQYITDKAKDGLEIIGDDLFVTNINRLKKGIDEKTANAILKKPNQIGTVSETIETIELAKKSSYQFMVSHRSGETCDSFIADLVVGAGGDQIKSGSLARSERLSKYNRLIKIEHQLNG